MKYILVKSDFNKSCEGCCFNEDEEAIKCNRPDNIESCMKHDDAGDILNFTYRKVHNAQVTGRPNEKL